MRWSVISITVAVIAGWAAGHSLSGAIAIFALAPSILLLRAERLTQLVTFAVLGQGAQNLAVPGLGVSVVFMGVIALLPYWWLKATQQQVRGTGVLPIFVYCGVTVLALVGGTIHSGASTSWGALMELANYMAVFVLLSLVSVVAWRLLVLPVAAATALHISLGLYEVIAGASLFYADWKPEEATRVGGFTRAASTVADPNYLAVTLLILAVANLHFARRIERKSGMVRLIGVMALVAIPLTFSRAGIAAVLIAIVFYAGMQRRARFSVLIGAASVAVATFIAATIDAMNPVLEAVLGRMSADVADASLSQRLLVQRLGLDLAADNWLLGIGPGQFPKYSVLLHDPTRPYDVQTAVLNTYLFWVLAGGAICLVAYLLLVCYAVRRSLRAEPLMAATIIGLSVAIVTLDVVTLAPVWLLLALAVVRRGMSLNRSVNGELERQWVRSARCVSSE